MLIAIMPFVNKFTALNGRFHGCGLLMDILFLLEKKNTSMIKDSSWSRGGEREARNKYLFCSIRNRIKPVKNYPKQTLSRKENFSL